MNTEKLPTEFKSKWIAALRSGEYEQATGELVDVTKENCYCSIGLAGHVAGIKDNQMSSEGGLWEWMKGVERVPLMLRCQKTFGGHHRCYIIYMNDYLGKSFSEIADYIEANL